MSKALGHHLFLGNHITRRLAYLVRLCSLIKLLYLALSNLLLKAERYKRGFFLTDKALDKVKTTFSA